MFSKKHICNVLLNIKNSLVNHAKQICGRILQRETSRNLHINMFSSFIFFLNDHKLKKKEMSSPKKIKTLKKWWPKWMDGQRYRWREKTWFFLYRNMRKLHSSLLWIEWVWGSLILWTKYVFFLYLKKNKFWQISRLWSYISHILKTLKERQLFLSLLEQDESKLILMFNYDKNLIYQSRDVPTNLKFDFFFFNESAIFYSFKESILIFQRSIKTTKFSIIFQTFSRIRVFWSPSKRFLRFCWNRIKWLTNQHRPQDLMWF